jgi:hypothetical protein
MLKESVEFAEPKASLLRNDLLYSSFLHRPLGCKAAPYNLSMDRLNRLRRWVSVYIRTINPTLAVLFVVSLVVIIAYKIVFAGSPELFSGAPRGGICCMSYVRQLQRALSSIL